ncbi:MAG: hypothetical protein HYZ28_23110 [Myxococcales bacterium]|nr:hypothetical protein [Myxococcales bacterium]
MARLTALASAGVLLFAGAARGQDDGLGDLEAEKSAIVAEGKRLEEDAEKINGMDDRLDRDRPAVERAEANLNRTFDSVDGAQRRQNSKVGDFNSQCYGQLPEPQYSRCVYWKQDLDREQVDLDRRWDGFEGEKKAFIKQRDDFNGLVESRNTMAGEWTVRKQQHQQRVANFEARQSRYLQKLKQGAKDNCASYSTPEAQAHCLQRYWDGAR